MSSTRNDSGAVRHGLNYDDVTFEGVPWTRPKLPRTARGGHLRRRWGMAALTVDEVLTELTELTEHLVTPQPPPPKKPKPFATCPFCGNNKMCGSAISDSLELLLLVQRGTIPPYDAEKSKPKVRWCNGSGAHANLANGTRVTCKAAYADLVGAAALLAKQLHTPAPAQLAAAPPPAPPPPAPPPPAPPAPVGSTAVSGDVLTAAASTGYTILDLSALLERNKDQWAGSYGRYYGKDTVFDSVCPDTGKVQMHAGAKHKDTVTGQIVDNKRYRWQGPAANASVSWAWVISTMLMESVRPFGFLSDPSGRDKPWDLCVKMTSTPGGPNQPRHADSAPRDSLHKMDDRKLPWALLFATEEGTKIKIWKKGHAHSITLTLKKGQLLIMRGDLGHCGCGYSVLNSRIHMYIDSLWVNDDGLEVEEQIKRRGKSEDRDTFTFQ